MESNKKLKLGVLFSGGKDSCYAIWIAKKRGYEISCLITIFSENKESYMFHTPVIELTKKQAELIGLPIIIKKTKGEKEKELKDLEETIREAIKKFKINGIVTGALASSYQAERIQKICDKFGIECFNPLWQKNQVELLNELVKEKFEVIIVGVAAYPFDKEMIGEKIDTNFIEKMKKMQEKYKINPAGEGGEIETLVLNCPLFKKKLNFKIKNIIGEGNNWRVEV
jgi:asparagine synthase (glutamine-hydrolysing)